METKANFILIGVFTLAGILGILGFFVWFAQVEFDRQFDYYDIRFSSVAGLSNASDVRFAGLPVGQVVDVRLAPDRDGTVVVRIEVEDDTPVRTDSVATIDVQGVTGVSFVSIDAGSPSSPLLERESMDAPVPEIEAGRSTLQSLSEDAPRLLEESLRVVEELGDLLGAENRRQIDNILSNIETASEGFADALEDFTSVTTTVSDFAEQMDAFNDTLTAMTGDLSGVLQTADGTLVSIRELSEQGKGVLAAGSQTLEQTQSAISSAETFITDDLGQTAEELRLAAADIRAQIATLSEDASALMATLNTTGETATARLREARETLTGANELIARLDGAAARVGSAAGRIDTLIETDGAPLIAETRAMVAEADRAIASVAAVANEDLPTIVADIRSAASTFRTVTENVGQNLTASSETAEEVLTTARNTLEDASESFANANTTLAAINDALDTGERALGAAERAFSGADRVINEDLDGIITGLETTLDSLNGAIAQVSDDIPGITGDLREAGQAAAAAFSELRGVTRDSAPSVREFTTTALPLFTKLAQETRTLVSNLDRLTNQIQRDPARFFLDRETPEFRR
ncbi:MlaD family protein [Marivita sp. GX14005]|uniref:MlaD family protein n=1 Tax=Marivita sp. GX14005 TaxID=2942276 RepID=UPI002018B9ED|nr:MlaD family protein [Marivita sp. GX14005]MCL3881190.1 MlaD family protein [Marivita sp. GX14005]